MKTAVYSQTNDTEEKTKERLCHYSQRSLPWVPEGNVLSVGEFSYVPAGVTHASIRHILPICKLGLCCNDRNRLVSSTDFNRMVFCSTYFRQSERHLRMWYSTDGPRAHQPGRIMTRSCFTSSVVGYRGKENGVRSYHNSVDQKNQ